jgi:pimeloyl-[acyl-carrier protein] synthase
MSAPSVAPAAAASATAFFSAGLLENPYPLYAMLRGSTPVFQVPVPVDVGAGVFLLTRYAEVQPALRDTRLSADRRKSDAVRLNAARLPRSLLGEESVFRSMLVMDPPDHTRVRGLVNKAFTPRRVAALRPRVVAIADELLAEPARAQRMELMTDLAAPLPAIVIAELLGVPAADHPKFRRWAADIISAGSEIAAGGDTARSESAFAELADYLKEIIRARRREPRDDMITGLVAAQEDRDALSDVELVATAVLLLLAGHETTTNLIGNGTLALLQHPDQLARLRAEPDLLRSAIEEMLRFDSPVQGTARAATEDVEYGGVAIPKGALVACAIGAANRDPAVFPEPDRFDVGRRENHHLSFGFGAHFCLGAPLARLEGEIAFRSLLGRFPKLALAGTPIAHRPNPILRGLQSLEVRAG